MATFLKLCQDTASDSGVVPNKDDPVTVEGQTGRLDRIVGWVNEAYQEIQNESPEWRWLKSDFAGQTIAGVQSYNAAAMSISSRFSRWLPFDSCGEGMFSIYRTTDGQDQEGFLTFVEWETFRRRYMFGQNAAQTGQPSVISINDQDEIVLFPTPDAAYTVRGRYYKAPQELVNNSDVPEMPEQFHSAIKWRALMFMATFDENVSQDPRWSSNFAAQISRISAHQLPKVSLGGPLV